MYTVPLIWITLQQQGSLTYKVRVFGPREYGNIPAYLPPPHSTHANHPEGLSQARVEHYSTQKTYEAALFVVCGENIW